MERNANQREVITFDLHGYGNLQINSRRYYREAVRIGAKMSGGEFPIEVFPIRIQHIISSLHDCQGDPVDYVAAAIHAAIAVGIGNCNRKSGIHQNRQRGYIKNCNNRTSETVTTVHQKR